MLRLINQLEKIDEGRVLIDKIDVAHLNKKQLCSTRRRIGMIFQHFNLLSSKTVFENVALPLRLIKTPEHEIQEKVNSILEKVGLLEKKHTYPSQLSGGQKQRVAIARALVNRPDILLCDEATSALDPETTQSILDLLKNLQQEFNLTLVMVTHQMEVVKSICDRVAVMQGGQVVEVAIVEEFFLRPKSEMGKALHKQHYAKTFRNILKFHGIHQLEVFNVYFAFFFVTILCKKRLLVT